MQNGYRQKFTRLLVRKNEKARCDFNTGREIETHKKNNSIDIENFRFGSQN